MSVLLLLPLFFPVLLLTPAWSELVLESGYAVSTVLDCNKPLPVIHSAAAAAAAAAIYPFSLLPRGRSGDVLLLDSADSAFYSLPVPFSQDGEIRLFAGKGVAGFADGDPAGAMFDRPRSFATDSRDNVYVADSRNGAIRKISPSGFTTTIAGGYSSKTGHIDGPAQNASFSNDFELVYIPKLCALLISDRANRLVRQMDLKPEDCSDESKSGLGAASVSVIAVLCVLFGSALGFVARPFFSCHEDSSNRCVTKSWKTYRASLVRLERITCSDIKSAAANSLLFRLMVKLVNMSHCYLDIVFRNMMLEKRVQSRETVSLLDLDVASSCAPTGLFDLDVASSCSTGSLNFADQLKDLLSFDEGMDVLEVNSSLMQGDEMIDGSTGSHRKIDDMIGAHFSEFSLQPQQQGQVKGSSFCSSGLVKRRPREVDGQ